MLGQSPLVDARVETMPADRGAIEQTLPFWMRLRTRWRRRMALRVEDALHDLGAPRGGARMVAPLITPVLLVPAIVILREPNNVLAMLCLAAGAVALVYALISDAIEQRARRASVVQIVNVVFYAAMISIVLSFFVALDHPRAHLHWVVFFLYFLLIGSVGMTDDPRKVVVAGSVSVTGYCAVVIFAHHASATGFAMASRLIPEFEWVANSAKLTMLAGATVLAVASAERGRELRRLSLRDGLTGLLNRRAFDDCLERLAQRAAESDTPLTIAMIDIDHFKRLNDQFGHTTGDTVLRWVASRIERSFRASDLVARYGGEEFVVALPDTADAGVLQRLEVLRAHIATSVLRERRPEVPGMDGSEVEETDIRTSISIGVAQIPADGLTPAAVLARADARLYEAKAAGRNRISRAQRANQPS